MIPTLVLALVPAQAAAADDYLLMPRAELLSLPMSGSDWTALKGVADSAWGAPNLCNQDVKHGAKALAGALVFARTGTSSYSTKVRDAIMSAMGTERSDCLLLSIGRQLASYVLAADLIHLSGSDDTTFRSWLSAMRTRTFTGHGRWRVLINAHADSNNNWGAFIGASRIAASLYLGDTTDVSRAAQVTRGFMGDRGSWDGFRTGLYAGELAWSCSGSGSTYTPINGACSKSGINADGAIVGDVYRDDSGLRWPVGANGIGYTLESLQGLTLQTELLYRNGYSGAWGWSNAALRRAAGLVTRNKNAGGYGWNYSSVSYHVPWLLNFRYDLDLPTVAAGHGRMFGYTDWLYGGRSGTVVNPTPRPTATPTPAPTATPRPTATPAPTATPRPTTTPRPTANPTAAPTPTTDPTTTPTRAPDATDDPAPVGPKAKPGASGRPRGNPHATASPPLSASESPPAESVSALPSPTGATAEPDSVVPGRTPGKVVGGLKAGPGSPDRTKAPSRPLQPATVSAPASGGYLLALIVICGIAVLLATKRLRA